MTDSGDTATTVVQLRALVLSFIAERDWEKYHDTRNVAISGIEPADLLDVFPQASETPIVRMHRNTAQTTQP